MRIIAGTHRSRLLVSPPGTTTRPTSDRLRETLFNILGLRIQGARFVDLYAGTGAVGLEALSRGATHVFFAEKAEPALQSLRTNLANLNITQAFTLEPRGTQALLQRLTRLTQSPASPASNQVDLIFLDPPYEAQSEYMATLTFLGSLAARTLMAANALIVVEHATRSSFQLPHKTGTLTQTRRYKQGETSLTFFTPATHSEE